MGRPSKPTKSSKYLEDLYEDGHTLDWLELMNTQILIPPEVRIPNIGELLKLTSAEVNKLELLTINTRMFLIKQDGRVIATELSIGGLQGLTRFLSSGNLEIEAYTKIIEQYSSEKPEDWVGPLYDTLEKVT